MEVVCGGPRRRAKKCHVPTLHYTCKGLSDLCNGPNKPPATIIGEYSAPSHDGALTFTLARMKISGSGKNLATFSTTPTLHHICKGLSDLGNGPSKPSDKNLANYISNAKCFLDLTVKHSRLC